MAEQGRQRLGRPGRRPDRRSHPGNGRPVHHRGTGHLGIECDDPGRVPGGQHQRPDLHLRRAKRLGRLTRKPQRQDQLNLEQPRIPGCPGVPGRCGQRPAASSATPQVAQGSAGLAADLPIPARAHAWASNSGCQRSQSVTTARRPWRSQSRRSARLAAYECGCSGGARSGHYGGGLGVGSMRPGPRPAARRQAGGDPLALAAGR